MIDACWFSARLCAAELLQGRTTDPDSGLMKDFTSHKMSLNATDGSAPPGVPILFDCFTSTVGLYTMSSFIFTHILIILPLDLSVLYLGIQRRRRRRPAESTSYIDFFTYHLAVIGLISALGYFLYFFSSYRLILLPISSFMGFFAWFGEMLLPILTCMERYLAVVHPITYLGLRKAYGVKVRNLSVACVWMLSLAGASFLLVLMLYPVYGFFPAIPVLFLFFVVMTFCSLSSLCVLIRPRPGSAGGDRKRAERSKRRAVRSIMVIMGVLWLKLLVNVLSASLSSSASETVRCLGNVSVLASSLPSSMMLPLMFLQRAGKLPNFKH